jgi:TPR repeat protein
MYKALATLLLFLANTCLYAAGLTSSQQAAKEKGIQLFNQYKTAEPELKIAAEAGDSEAQYYLAEELRQKSRYITAEAMKWYEAAAAQNDLYSMLRLARSKSDLCEAMKNCTIGQKKPSDG